MTLKELYAQIDGDYDKAMQVLRIEKLMDKHIKKLPANTIFNDLENAGKNMDGVALFESSHAIKGVCSNLGLVKLAGAASDISEEFRPGNERKMTDAQVQEILSEIKEQFEKTALAIKNYEQSA